MLLHIELSDATAPSLSCPAQTWTGFARAICVTVRTPSKVNGDNIIIDAVMNRAC